MGAGMEDIYSMLNKNIGINFSDLLDNYNEIINYVSKKSDSFSVISNLNKPYSKQPPNYEHENVLKVLEPFLERYVIGIKSWPGTITKDNHKVMITYRLCKESRSLLKEMPNFFLPLENGLPEDICFFRNQKPWFVTTSHEKTVFIVDATNEDVSYLKEMDITVYE